MTNEVIGLIIIAIGGIFNLISYVAWRFKGNMMKYLDSTARGTVIGIPFIVAVMCYIAGLSILFNLQ